MLTLYYGERGMMFYANCERCGHLLTSDDLFVTVAGLCCTHCADAIAADRLARRTFLTANREA